jgi:SnoaL-like domain
MTLMSDSIHELLYRNLQEVFGEGNAARRQAAIAELYAEDCVLYAPPGIFVGPDALDKFACDLRTTHPHFVYTPHGEAQTLHNAGRLAWGSGRAASRPPTQAWMWSSSAMERSRRFMCSSILYSRRG